MNLTIEFATERSYTYGWLVYVYFMCVCPHALSASYHADSVVHVLGEQQLTRWILICRHACMQQKISSRVMPWINSGKSGQYVRVCTF